MVALNWIVIALAGYVVGSIPTSVWVSKAFFGFDIRDKGSGNAGATNAWRVLGWKAALFVVLVDVGKGFVATAWLSTIRLNDAILDPNYTMLVAGIAAMLGHVWTLFAGFRGGKGVATLGGMLVALFPTVFPICLLVFVMIVLTTRYVSLASICAATALPIGLAVLHWGFKKPVPPIFGGVALLIVFFIIYTHRSNIRRLMAGQENKIGAPKSAA